MRLHHIKEEAPAVEILADVVKRNLQQYGVAKVAGLFDACRNPNLEQLCRGRAGRLGESNSRRLSVSRKACVECGQEFVITCDRIAVADRHGYGQV